MRFARKLLLLALAAIAAMAVAASPASATNAIEVVNTTDGGVHCSKLTPDDGGGDDHTSGGCQVHAEGTMTLDVWIFTWVTERTCDVEFEMRVGEDGQGAVDDLEFDSIEPGTDTDCKDKPPVTMCNVPWEGAGERDNMTTIHVNSEVCIDPAEGDVCGSSLEYNIIESGETYSVSFSNVVFGLCRINGNAQIEATTSPWKQIHIN